MRIVSVIVIGLVVGLLAHFFVPGKGRGGLRDTFVWSIAGAFIGGFVVAFVYYGTVSGYDTQAALMAFIGSILALAAYRFSS